MQQQSINQSSFNCIKPRFPPHEESTWLGFYVTYPFFYVLLKKILIVFVFLPVYLTYFMPALF